MTNYAEFLNAKKPRVEACGIEPGPINPILFDWQADIVRWALRRGRAALFEDCGLGKSFQQVEWLRQMTDIRGLILAPLSVAQQTIQEAARLGVEIRFVDEPVESSGLFVTNYQKLRKFADAIKGGWVDSIVLDESSILKSLDGKTRGLLLDLAPHVPHRLCCTATPAPNDLTELANHAEFLGAMSRAEMLATFFVHDSERSGADGWRLKGHAKEDFWRWVAQWAVYLRRPSDLGYEDGGFQLPALDIRSEMVMADFVPDGQLFAGLTGGVQGRIKARRATLADRVRRAAEIINATGEQWIVWHALNAEGSELAAMLGPDCALIEGSTPDDRKVEMELKWRAGVTKALITKGSIFGWGLNWQHCHNVLYLGLGDSFEQWYQSVRRCWRFGQERPVNVVIVTSDAESEIVDNVQRKERQAEEMAQGIIDAMRGAQIENFRGKQERKGIYKLRTEKGSNWEMRLGDCVERIKEIETAAIGLSVFSPPFAKLYTYSASERDMGNCKDYDQFFKHFGFLIPELLRVTMPGRRCCVHAQDIALTKVNDGVIGIKDFSRDITIEFERHGWIYDGRITIDKDPQAQAIRTKAKALMFTQKNKDSAWSRPAMADYILLFRKPGENPQPIKTDVSNDEWIKFARPIWYGIEESDTLNYQTARESADERHICPLQLGTIERCVRLWSNRGDLVLSPFAGIGSEGYVSLQHSRRFIGIELKESYFNQAVKNLQAAVRQESLFGAAA